MVNMKDVPSTERMVLCSKQWKMLTQKEKDMFQKRCEQVGPDPTRLVPTLLPPPLTPLPVCRKRSSMTWTCSASWR